jgi:hypothetical protein
MQSPLHALRVRYLLAIVLALLPAAAFAQPPTESLTTATPGVYAEDGNLYVALPIENVGAASVLHVQVESIRVASGSVLTPAAFPVVLGDIQPGESAVLNTSFTMPSMMARAASLIVSGTYLVGNDLRSFMLQRALTIPQPDGEAKLMNASAEPQTQLGAPFPPQPLPSPAEHEQTTVPPIPIGPFREGSTALEMEVQIPGPNSATATRTIMAPSSDPLVIVRNTAFGTNPGDPPDMSGASGGRVVLATANTYLAVSTDDGVSFTTVNPSAIWSDVASPAKDSNGKTIDMGICCDQVVRYVASIDRFVWLMQFNQAPSGKGTINKYRLAAASPADIRTKGVTAGGVWTYWDLTSDTFNLGDNWMDYPDMAIGNKFLYMSTNKVNVGGFMVRIPLTEIRDRLPLHIGYSKAGICAKMTRNAADEVFCGILAGNSAISIYSIKESSNSYVWRTVKLATWDQSDFTAVDPKGKQWILGAVGFTNVMGAARRYLVNPNGGYFFNELWYAWNVGRDSKYPYPSVELVRLDAATFAVIQQVRIFNSQYAFTYPDIAPNELGGGALAGFDVGFTFLWGGGPIFYGNLGVGIFGLDPFPAQMVSPGNTQLASVGLSDGSPLDRSGDYFTVNPHWPQPGAFSAFVYRVLLDPHEDAGWRWECRAIRFGRSSFFGL